ncbi:sugar-binding transcriptional regulator [Photobacterium minamisatsumaniensis]|uniref:sugar-binding transcriptional regulator n=1 Tax=Photobacterium minamisatsumaniensis TaxID=2910233 RepID=UPI003D0A4495
MKSDQMVRAAWMYYVLGKSQSEIASQLGTSRPVVQRLIAAAKDEGIVSIGLHHPIASCLDYAELIKEKYQLIECNIVPNDSDESLINSMSFGCFQIMSKFIKDQPGQIIGIGSGITLKKAINRIDFTSSDSKCVALISAMSSDGQCNYYDDVPLILASRIKANYYQWPTPRYARTPSEHQMWCGNELFNNVLSMADRANIIFIGIGSLGKDSPIVKDGFITHEQDDELAKQGSVGEILGRFIDSKGDVVNCKINELITSYDIRNNPCPRIAVAGGIDKREAILAALKGKWINGLVTDELTARWLLTK